MPDRMYPGIEPVKPWVRDAARTVGNMFDVKTIYGFGARSNPSDHPKGLALDFMVYGDRSKGDQIAGYMIGVGAKEFGVSYVIWWQKINSVDGDGWEEMEDRGSVTANHKDHVHVSFEADGEFHGNLNPIDVTGSGQIAQTDVGSGILADVRAFVDAMKSLDTALAWVSDSHNWLRVGMVVGGAVLILIGITRLGVMPDAVTKAAKRVGRTTTTTRRVSDAVTVTTKGVRRA